MELVAPIGRRSAYASHTLARISMIPPMGLTRRHAQGPIGPSLFRKGPLGNPGAPFLYASGLIERTCHVCGRKFWAGYAPGPGPFF
jgi:hypothetical protein